MNARGIPATRMLAVIIQLARFNVTVMKVSMELVLTVKVKSTVKYRGIIKQLELKFSERKIIYILECRKYFEW